MPLTELQQQYLAERDHRALMDIPTGATVMKPSASQFDFAYLRKGIVTRETIPDQGYMCGVVWEGSNIAFLYPSDMMFDVVNSNTGESVMITADKELEKTKKEALMQSKPLLSQVTSLVVNDAASFQQADTLRENIRKSRKAFWDRVTLIVDPAYKAWKGLTEFRGELTKPLDDADEVITGKMKEFKRQELVRVREEERRREIEAAKLREQAAEKLRREETAKTAQMQAKLAMQREALEDKADEVEARPIETVKAANSGTRTVTKIRVVNKMALLKAIVADDLPLDLVDVDMAVLNQMIKQLDKETAVQIGCEIYEDVQIVSGRRS